MNREKIIELALNVDATEHKTESGNDHTRINHFFEFTTDELERFAAAIEAEQAEIIAAQQARIAELVEVLDQFLDDMGSDGHCVCPAAKKWGVRTLSRTDDLSALNEAKAQVLEDAAKTIGEDNFSHRQLMRMAQELTDGK